MKDYQLIQGECLEQMAFIPDGSVDMVMCDLPYGTTQNKWDSVISLEPLWKEYGRSCKANAAIILTASQPFTSSLILSNIKNFKYCWVWDKRSPTGHLNAKHQPMRRTEDVVVFGEGQTTYNPQGLIWNPRKKTRSSKTPGSENYGAHGDSNIATWQGYPTNVLVFGADKNKQHPTQKPVALMEYLIRTYTNEGETVLDNTMGSGTTGVACMNASRRFIGIEREEKYFNIAKERIDSALDKRLNLLQ
jgi:site-specific DNA-methyltransferase (adenine-specific)